MTPATFPAGAVVPRPLGHTDTLVLMVSRDCNIQCDFCSVPPDGRRLPPDLCLDLVEQSAACPGLDVVAFTGGEPFLQFPALDEAGVFDALARFGIPWKVISNAFWARSAAAARDTLAPLVDRGLFLLSLSTDPSHQRFLPAERIEMAARAGLDLGLLVHVQGVFQEAGRDVREVVDLPEHPRLTSRTDVVSPFGRARDLDLSFEALGFGAEPFARWSCYTNARYDVLVTPSGDVHPCCSPGVPDSELRYGNVRTERLATLYRRVRDDYAVRLLKYRSFADLYRAVETVDPALHARLPDPGAHASACHLCEAVFSSPGLARAVRRALGEHLLMRVAAQSRSLAEAVTGSRE